MDDNDFLSSIKLPYFTSLAKKDYYNFLKDSYKLLKKYPQYLSDCEGIESLELAHLLPRIPETMLTAYVGINDAVCNKGLVTPFLPRHAHNNVFVFDPQFFPGKDDVPEGTIDAKEIINDFRPPNETWRSEWTYVMISGIDRDFSSLWREKGYIDMIPAKFEDFTMISDHIESMVCTFIDPMALEHPVNKSRDYLDEARRRGEQRVKEFTIPELLQGEIKNLVPLILNQGEKLYVARPDFLPCDHCWSNIHPDNKGYAVVNENSAVPLDLVTSKPAIKPEYKNILKPPAGSADNTTDWFFRGKDLFRTPVKPGHIAG